MLDIGMIRGADIVGRIVLPVELRRVQDINPGDNVEFFVDGDQLVLQKFGCIFCGSIRSLEVIKGKNVCRMCLETAAEMIRVEKTEQGNGDGV